MSVSLKSGHARVARQVPLSAVADIAKRVTSQLSVEGPGGDQRKRDHRPLKRLIIPLAAVCVIHHLKPQIEFFAPIEPIYREEHGMGRALVAQTSLHQFLSTLR